MIEDLSYASLLMFYADMVSVLLNSTIPNLLSYFCLCPFDRKFPLFSTTDYSQKVYFLSCHKAQRVQG